MVYEGTIMAFTWTRKNNKKLLLRIDSTVYEIQTRYVLNTDL